MKNPQRPAAALAYGNALGELAVEVFRVNGLLLSAGDALTRDLGLSSARWQVLGALELAGRPLSVSQIARNMGLVRQSVQRLADDLARDGFVSFAANPDHRRAKLVALSKKGREAFAAAMRRQGLWARRVASSSGIGDRKQRDAAATLRALRSALEGERNDKAG
jgi:DNA-binding MarR family transcriptional regulator